MTRHIEVRIQSAQLPPDQTETLQLTGRERIGSLFELEVELVARDDRPIRAEDVLGGQVQVSFLVDGDNSRTICGTVAHLSESFNVETERLHYRLRVVPRAHRLTLSRTQEVYQHQSVPEIIMQKLQLAGLSERDVQLRLSGNYPSKEFVVQYAETDLAFVSRLAEHVGISFFFEEQDGKDVMVFSDDNRFLSLGDESAVVYRPRMENSDVRSVRRDTDMVPTLYAVYDYNYRTPLVELTGIYQSDTGSGGGVLEYGSHVKTQQEAQALAEIRAQEHECRRVLYHIESHRPDLGAGRYFRLAGHTGFGDQSLLAVEVEHRLGRRSGGPADGGMHYSNSVCAVNAELRYRPARATPRPRVHGLLSGTVMPAPGSSGVQPAIDDQGRYLVRLLFDTADAQGKAARPMRMIQAHAGPGYGMHFPLRPGVEVVLAFIDGDIDRPIIVGAVPNVATPSPVVGNEHLRHRIRTATGVEIEFEDAL